MDFAHRPVLLQETLDMLNIDPEGVYVDGTLGGGGHSAQIARLLTTGRLIGIDRDADAIDAAAKRLEAFSDRIILIKDNFKNIKGILKGLGISVIDGCILDLGVSSWQLDSADRGFSYKSDAPLDMRMDRDLQKSAYNVVNEYSEEELRDIIHRYGEERWSARIARFIIEERKKAPIETTARLAQIIKNAIPSAARREGPHPAKRTFQAIRIEVNQELEGLEGALYDFFDCLKPQGRLAVITFHSLEDRIVKETFKDLCTGCICPKELPLCVCGRQPRGRLIVRRPVTASNAEQMQNPRSRSAKLRGIIRL